MSTLSDVQPAPSIARPTALWELVERAAATAQKLAPIALRVSLAVVFIWFGAMKITGDSPVADLVTGAVPFVDASWFLPLLGAVEVALGLGLLFGGNLLVVGAMIAHLIGTFTVFVVTPDVAFQAANPLLLSTEGEFILKNIVLVAAAMALVRIPRSRRLRAAF